MDMKGMRCKVYVAHPPIMMGHSGRDGAKDSELVVGCRVQCGTCQTNGIIGIDERIDFGPMLLSGEVGICPKA